MNILITGGAGYIGNYITEQLVKNHSVIIVDNLSTGHKNGIHESALFYKGDIRDEDFLDEVFKKNEIDVVIHMAALISAPESVIKPLEYYDINTYGTLTLLRTMKNNGVKKIVFSSTAAVYGNPTTKVIDENVLTMPINPYGKSKLYAERIIEDLAISDGIDYVIFRYFNVAGGRKVGYGLSDMSSLIPKVLESVNNDSTVFINGGDYDTKDGTCVRDYVHILDLAKAHILATESLFNGANCSGTYNLGNGKGYTIMEVINSTEHALNCKVNYEIVDRRDGDPVYSVASSKNANDIFNWKPDYPQLHDIITHMWDENNGVSNEQ